MNKSESIKELAAALAKFQGEVTNPTNSETVTVKTKSGASYSYKYAPLDEILKLVRPILSKNGLAIVQVPHSTGKEMFITTTLLHSSGEWIEYPPLSLMATDLSPQSAGSVITYGRRYALSAILGIASDDDNDGNGSDPEEDKKDDKNGKDNDRKEKPLSDAQIKRLYTLGKIAKYDENTVKGHVKVRFNKNVEDMTKAEYDAVCKGYEGRKW